eukprot:7377239-Prymnesium_polylepis.2
MAPLFASVTRAASDDSCPPASSSLLLSDHSDTLPLLRSLRVATICVHALESSSSATTAGRI